MNWRSFFGILPPQIPYDTDDVAADAIPVPPRVTILWPGGARSQLRVGVGDSVRTGENLSRANGRMFLSTVTGKISSIDESMGPDGLERLAVSIETAHKEELDPAFRPVEDPAALSQAELIAALTRAGFPAMEPLVVDPATGAPVAKVEAVVVSALDRNPLTLVNQQALRDRADLVGPALDLLRQATGARKMALAVPSNLADRVSKISTNGARVEVIPAQFPNGMLELLSFSHGAGRMLRRNPDGIIGNTFAIGLEQATSMVSALREGRPFLEKTLTCSRTRGGRFRNLRVRIGTPVFEILRALGINLEPRDKLILNGPLNGYACFSDEQPVLAVTDSLHAQPAGEVFRFQDGLCVNCGKCTRICPVGLEANLIGRYSEYGLFDRCKDLVVDNCVECGLCSYVCPGHRPVFQWITHAKVILRTLPEKQKPAAEEALGCGACGPSCPAVRLFDFTADSASKSGQEATEK